MPSETESRPQVETQTESRPQVKAWTVLLPAMVTFVLTILILLWGSWRHEFFKVPQSVIWLIAVALVPSYLVLVYRSLLLMYRRYRDELATGSRWWNGTKGQVWGLGALYLLLLFGPVAIRLFVDVPDPPLADYIWRIVPIYLFSFLIALLGVFSVWALNARVNRLGRTPDDLAAHISLRADLVRLGGILGVGVALGALAEGALRNAMLAAKAAGALPSSTSEALDRFSPQMVLLFGIYFTLLLALTYLPPYLNLLTAGRRIIDTSYPLRFPAVTPPSGEGLATNQLETDSKFLAAQIQLRKDVADQLQLNTSATESLKVATLVLAPLLTSLVSVLLRPT